MDVLFDVFKKNYLVVGLDEPAIKEISELAELKVYMAQELIIKQGEKSSDLFVVLDGRVKVITPSGDYLADVGPGSVLGEVSLIDAQPRSADAICVGTVRAAKIPAKQLRDLMNVKREMGFIVMVNLARVLCNRLRAASSRIDHLVSSDQWRGSV
jgi:CRP-like cAMP-binding protein